MRTSIAILATAFFVVGCARMGTRQVDKSITTRAYEIDEKGRTNRIVVTDDRETTTRASGVAVASGKSTFEGLDASQDGRAQGLKVKKASQTSDIDKALDVLGRLAPLAGALAGVPLSQSASPAQASPTMAAPAGMKWVLKPVDDPSVPQLETTNAPGQ